MNVEKNYVDSHGQDEAAFAFCHLLGFRLLPREYLDDALWSAKRGGELTHRLLTFARKQPLKPAVKSMTELLRRTLGASIRIEESLAPNQWEAFADRGELENALVNLAVNARAAMRDFKKT